MATSLRLLDAGPGSLRRWIPTCFAALLLLPPRPNLGYNEDHAEPVCGAPWWANSLEERHHWPWEVSLQIENEHVCGGALIDQSWVVSAAHCIQGNKEYSVMLGSSTLQPSGSPWVLKIPVGDIIMHPKYWGQNFIRSDIALLCLETPVTFNKYIQPICLPEHNFNLKVGMKCWVTGWGQAKQHPSAKLTRSLELWEAEVSIVDHKNCDRVFHKKTFYPQVIPLIRKNMICTTNHRENPCYGDPGGPLACEVHGRWILAGIFSWEKACTKAPNLSVYTRIDKYTGWIKEQVSRGARSGRCRISCLLFLPWLLQLPVSPGPPHPFLFLLCLC